jgi:hypothetical protein
MFLGIAHAVPPDSSATRPMTPEAGNNQIGKARPAPLRMQVEEPKSAAPAGAARENQTKAKQSIRTRALSESQKQAFRERKEKMESLIAVIKEKREAMAAAKPEERAAIAHELHSIMLETDPAADNTLASPARIGGDAPAAETGEKEIGDAIKDDDAAEKRHRQDEWRRQREHRKHNRVKSQAGNSDEAD